MLQIRQNVIGFRTPRFFQMKVAAGASMNKNYVSVFAFVLPSLRDLCLLIQNDYHHFITEQQAIFAVPQVTATKSAC